MSSLGGLHKIIFRDGKWQDFRAELKNEEALPTVPEGVRIIYKPKDEWDTTDLECGIDFLGTAADAPKPLSSFELEERVRLARLQSLRRTAENTIVYYSITDLYKMKNAYINLIGGIFNKYFGDVWLHDELLTPLSRDISHVFVDLLHVVPYRMKEHNPQ